MRRNRVLEYHKNKRFDYDAAPAWFTWWQWSAPNLYTWCAGLYRDCTECLLVTQVGRLKFTATLDAIMPDSWDSFRLEYTDKTSSFALGGIEWHLEELAKSGGLFVAKPKIG